MKWQVEANPFVKDINYPKTFNITEFDDKSLRSFGNCINDAIELDQKVIPIYINSVGGCSFTFRGFLSLMDSARKRGLKLATIANGCAMSAAFGCWAYGDPGLRFCAPDTILMAHYSQLSELEGMVYETKSFIDFISIQETSLYEKISKHLGKRADWFYKKLKNNIDWFMSPEEALKDGIANHIHLPSFKISIQSQVSIE
jgi:ATP-dependent protease ClpP protease subunit